MIWRNEISFHKMLGRNTEVPRNINVECLHYKKRQMLGVQYNI